MHAASGSLRAFRHFPSAIVIAGSIAACETVVVSMVEVSEVQVFPSSLTLVEGESETASAIVRSEGAEVPGLAVTWSVDDPLVATVSDVGVVEARAPGVTTVRAASEGVSGTAQVRVLARPNDQPDCDISDQTIGKLDIPRNTRCVLTNVRVRGSVELREGARLVASDLTVDGDLKALGAPELTIADSWIAGDVVFERGGTAAIRSTLIGKKLEIKSNIGAVTVSDTWIAETFKLEDNLGGPFTLQRNFSERIECEDNEPAPTGGSNFAREFGQCADL
jgi:uncharacterized protein YjdB